MVGYVVCWLVLAVVLTALDAMIRRDCRPFLHPATRDDPPAAVPTAPVADMGLVLAELQAELAAELAQDRSRPGGLRLYSPDAA